MAWEQTQQEKPVNEAGWKLPGNGLEMAWDKAGWKWLGMGLGVGRNGLGMRRLYIQ